ncbi:MAG TPA: deoxyribose-phosphate aldolase [Candidatus Krumholzibacteriaceae bacterium]|jgi:deoxyribose-phosphate aldolase|nr:deoxyribose-phosphate aldolase [Candidatus Krumholzibacteriaceae bacterium]
MISRKELAKMIDHTNIRPTATAEDIKQLCGEAIKYGFNCVVVNPTYVPLAVKLLKGAAVKVCATVGFPLGVTLSKVKAYETEIVAEIGAREFDMVINLGALKSKDYDLVKNDVKAVVDIKHAHPNSIIKVIIETGFLSEEEKVVACKLSKEAGADFVKTSTGLLVGKATIEDIKLMRKTVGPNMGVKASGGIRALKQALAMIEAGANRIGTSTGVQIVEEIPE